MDNKTAAGIGVATAIGMSVLTGQMIDSAPKPTETAQAAPVIEAPVEEYQPLTPVSDTAEYAPAGEVRDDVVPITTEAIELPTEEPPKKKFFQRVKEKVKSTFSRGKKSQSSAKTAQSKPAKKRRYYTQRKYNPTSWKAHTQQVDGRNIIPEGIKADFSRFKG
jgi:hypothetical protein